VGWVAGTVVTERESGDGDGRRVEGRRRSRVRRHEVQSIAVTAEERSRKMRRQCCSSCEELYWWKQCWGCDFVTSSSHPMPNDLHGD